VNIREKYYNLTTAEIAMNNNHNEVVELLISKGADISPLHFALYMKDKPGGGGNDGVVTVTGDVHGKGDMKTIALEFSQTFGPYAGQQQAAPKGDGSGLEGLLTDGKVFAYYFDPGCLQEPVGHVKRLQIHSGKKKGSRIQFPAGAHWRVISLTLGYDDPVLTGTLNETVTIYLK